MTEISQTSQNLLDFIKASPSCFHAINTITADLNHAGYTELLESAKWALQPGGKYYVTRNLSSLIAFRIPNDGLQSFMISASHSDSPTFKLKDQPELCGPENYIRLNTERYGGMIFDTWFDRPLSVAGRVLVRDSAGIRAKLVSIDRDLLLIPHVATHMLSANDGYKYNPACDLVPLYGLSTAKDSFMKLIAEAAGVCDADILGHDLFLVNRQTPSVWGADNEFVSSPKLDDLQCVFAGLKAFLAAEAGKSAPVLYIPDNEEVGSATKQGAGSTFLYDTLTRVNAALGYSGEDFLRAVASSMLLSADNAHAVHPNHPELADPTHRPKLNGGVVMKYNASQLYTTDAVSAAIFREICRKAEVPLQVFCNRSDMRGGSTLGNISNTQVSMNAVDIGIAQLAMHSSYETAGVLDTDYMIRAMKQFFETSLLATASGYQL